MPQISSFLRTAFGIALYMYYGDNDQHHLPHVHARFGGEEGVFDFEGNLIEGTLPRKKRKAVIQWIQDHQGELEDRWLLAIQDLPITPVD